MPTNWKMYGSETIAAILDKAELPGFWQQATVGPNECALVIKNGRIEETVTQNRVNTSGFLDRLKGLFGQSTDVQVIYVDTTPFSLSFFLGDTARQESGGGRLSTASSGFAAASSIRPAQSRAEAFDILQSRHQFHNDTSQVTIQALSIDSQPISAEAHLTISVDIEDAWLLSGLMKDKTGLATWDLAALIRDELLAKVLVPKISQYRADEFRGNSPLLSEIKQKVESELKSTFDLWGLTLENFFVHWGLTEQEQQEIEQARARRHEQGVEFAHRRSIKDAQRELDLNRVRLANLQEIKVLEERGEQEFQELYLNGELNRASIQDDQKINMAKVDARILDIQMDVQRQEANLQIDIEREQANIRLDIERREAQAKQDALDAQNRRDLDRMGQHTDNYSRLQHENHMREMELRRVDQENDFDRRKREQENEFDLRKLQLEQTRILSQGSNTSASDPSVLRTMLEQQTEQQSLQASDDKVQSRSEAQAARYSVESIREEQDRERSHIAETTRLAADMMEASKQIPPGQVIPPPDVIQTPLPGGPTVNMVNMPNPPATPPQAAFQAGGDVCPGCSDPIQTGWSFCPGCGGALKTDAK